MRHHHPKRKLLPKKSLTMTELLVRLGGLGIEASMVMEHQTIQTISKGDVCVETGIGIVNVRNDLKAVTNATIAGATQRLWNRHPEPAGGRRLLDKE